MENLESLLKRVDGKGYKAYKDIAGSYNYKDYKLNVLYVQGDPFASPSLFELDLNLVKHGFDPELIRNKSRRVAFEDYILRRVYKTIGSRKLKMMGSGRSGSISIYKPEQEILKRSAVEVKDNRVKVKLYLGLPAQGRRILAREAIEMISVELPKIAESIKRIDMTRLKEHVILNENIDLFRAELKRQGIKVFIANGSILARTSSVDDRPLANAIPFESPKSLEKEITLANGFSLTGMALKEGVTIITGGGFHGKSTLLNAIEKAIYNHISGDGREFCITNTDAVKIRAEDGRSVNKVDISSFIGNLPYGKDTKSFSTENASGSTSQASNIVEAIELGSKLLLIDEDTSATNFMVRDKKVQELITKDKEPITPFISKVSALYKKNRVSSIVVVGGLGDFFDVANKVLMLDNYKVLDITKRAKEIALKYKDEELTYNNSKVDVKNRRLNVSETIKVFNTKKVKLKNKDLDELIIGKDEINLRSVEQLVEFGQVNFIGELIRKIFTRRDLDKYTLRDILETYENRLKDESIEEMIGSKSGKLVYTRKYEVGAAINRIRKDLFI